MPDRDRNSTFASRREARLSGRDKTMRPDAATTKATSTTDAPAEPASRAATTDGDDEDEAALGKLTVDQLRERARNADIDGRSDMNKDELVSALLEVPGRGRVGRR